MQAWAHPKCLPLQACGVLEADPESTPLQGLLFLGVSWALSPPLPTCLHPQDTHTHDLGAGLALFYFALSSLKLLSWAFSYTNDTYKKIRPRHPVRCMVEMNQSGGWRGQSWEPGARWRLTGSQLKVTPGFIPPRDPEPSQTRSTHHTHWRLWLRQRGAQHHQAGCVHRPGSGRAGGGASEPEEVEAGWF